MRRLFQVMVFIVIFMLSNVSSNAQVSVAGNAGVPANYDGWNILQPFPLSMKHEAIQPIDFYTNAGALTFLNQKMQITANANPLLDGFVGIGNSNAAVGTAFQPGGTFPNFKLDVDGGDINIHQIAQGYRIGGSGASASNWVLRHSGTISSIYVGVGAGGSVAGFNTCVGWNAGNGITGGSANVIIGDRAGLVLGNSGGNTFVGHEAGVATNVGGENTFIGSFAGAGNLTGGGNTYVGEQAGRACTATGQNTMVGTGAGIVNQAGSNSFFGAAAGQSNIGGTENTFVGFGTVILNIIGNNTTALGARAGNISLGDLNTFLGSGSNVGVNTVTNGTAVGANAIIPANNQLILGNRVVSVGIGLSGDNVGPGPQNSLEINADAANFTYTGVGSGLRFRQLTDANPAGINTGPGILSVDGNGDVVYVEDIGNYCGESPQRQLRADYQIPLDRYNYYFDGQRDLSTNVIAGQTCNDPFPYAKLQSYQNTFQSDPGHAEANAGLFITQTNNKLAIGAVGKSEASEFTNIGLKGIVQEYEGADNYGVLGTTVSYPILMASKMNVGVYGFAKLRSHPTTTHVNYAVVGDLGIPCPLCIAPGGCPVCLPATAPDYAGYFNGDLITTTGIYNVSDAALKENIQDIIDPLSIINQLNPKSYTFKQDDNRSIYLGAGTHFGLLSQDVEAILPQLVKNSIHPARYDSVGNELFSEIDFKALNYTELIPFLIAAVKEQQLTIEAMQGEMANLSGGGNRNGHQGSDEGEGNGGKDQGISNTINVELKNSKSIILNQNVPNPFAEQTTISYFLTDDVKKAQIFFYDSKGVILKIVDINEKGTGQLNVYAADLSSGSYTYSLIADGKLIETKKMVKTN